jgi:SanA protein
MNHRLENPLPRPWLSRLLFASIILLAAPFLWQGWIRQQYQPHIYDVSSAPAGQVAIVFGARVFPDGRLSAMLRDRVETAVRLYEAGKVEKIIFSGDNRFEDYNEPGAMMAYAAARGVPLEAMQADYAGRRTYDTCYRARAVFQVEAAVLITQDFHLPRALFVCDSLGLEVTGVIADISIYSTYSRNRLRLREVAATSLALLDVIRQAPAPVLGEPIPLLQ